MAQQSHSQVSHNRRFATAVFLRHGRPFVKRCYFRFGSWPCKNVAPSKLQRKVFLRKPALGA